MKLVCFPGIDEYSDVSFAIPGKEEMAVFLGKPFISLIGHPGMVLFTPKQSIQEQVDEMLKSIFMLWPVFALNLSFITVAGIVYFLLVNFLFYYLPIKPCSLTS